MRRRVTSTFFLGMLMTLIASAALAATASAGPVWKFNGAELTETETITGDAILSSFTVPGLTTKCKKMTYTMKISNVAGTGKGEVTGLSFKTCVTNSSVCTVKSIKAETLPWAAHLTKLIASNYVIVEGVKIAILYAGEECVLGETLVMIKGSVGGLYDNSTETFTFNGSNSKATKTELKALSSAIEWNGAFTTEALGLHAGEALTVS